MSDTLSTLISQAAEALMPLENALASPTQVQAFLANLGWQLPPGVSDIGLAGLDISGLVDATLVLMRSSDSDWSNIELIAQRVANLVEQLEKLFAAVSKVMQSLAGNPALPPGYLAATQLDSELLGRILDYLIITYVQQYYSLAYQVLRLAGIIQVQQLAADPALHQTAHERLTLNFDAIGALLSSNRSWASEVFGWGTASADITSLINELGFVFSALGASPFVGKLSGPMEAAIVGHPVPQSATDPMPLLTMTLLQGFLPDNYRMGVQFFALRPSSPGTLDAGLGLMPFTSGTSQLSFPLPTASNRWSVGLDVSADLDGGIVLSWRPGAPLKVQTGVFGGGATSASDGKIALALTYAVPAGDDATLFTLPGGTSLTLQGVTISGGAQISSGGATDGFAAFALQGSALTISMGDADSFLTSLISPSPMVITLDLSVSYSQSTGLTFNGGAGLQTAISLNITIGPFTIETLYIELDVSGQGLAVEASVNGSGTLGPISVSVERVGLSGQLSFPSSGGNLAVANIAAAFKPPDGLGLEIDAGPASGGGYISFDPAQGQYAGVLDVSLLDIVQVKVIGVIDTIMPDGSSGFSFILVITFDLPPIALGFGFTLNGVGGIGGVNRTINTPALQAGFVAHSLNSILFPPNPIANAPEIISNLRNFFPVAEDSYVFGPMMEFGWGTPTLITLEIGVILELPNPVVIVLLGLVDVALPDSDAPLIQLHIDILGELDFGTKTLELEGDMYDSSVLIYSMAGSLYFSVCWGSDPNFVYSVGGFNQDFNTAGLNLPPMQRCSVSIGFGDNPRISANNYFAVTSNSLQFGANVQAYASAAGFTIQGYLGFDVLIIFSPFSFEFDFTVSFSVSFEGINLLGLSVSGSFSGPRPWNLNGTASISILFWTVSASVNLTWGDSTPVAIPQKPVLTDLANALQAPGNWSAALPAGMTPAISLSAPSGGSPSILVYPMGTLSVRENVVPLDVTITRYGNATPSDGNLFAISDVQINSQEAQRQTFQEYFAPGQFNALNDADKLSAPSFELYDAGVTIGSSAINSGEDRARTVVYEEFYIDSPMSYSRSTGPYLMDADIAAALTRQGAGFNSPVVHSGLSKYSAGPALGTIATADEGYVIANTNDLSVRTDIVPAAGVTYFHARAALATHQASNPADTGTLQIVTVYEAAA
jgi:Family of unknown function (DUF6603)